MNIDRGLNRIIVVFCFLMSFYCMFYKMQNTNHAMSCDESAELAFLFFITWIVTSFFLWVVKNIAMWVVLWVIIGFKNDKDVTSS